MKKLIFILFICFGVIGANAQAVSMENKPSKINSPKPIAEGANVWGVFEGRVSCQEMTKAMNIKAEANCEKLKWRFTFFQDPVSHEPTTYIWFGSMFRDKPREGKWKVVKGTAVDPGFTLIQIDPDKPEQTFFLLKGDENVLFVLDKNKKLMVGGDYLSYTFNRIVN